MPPALDLDSELRNSGSLTACLAIVGAPAAALADEGAIVGYNVDFATEIADRLGLAFETRSPLFDDLIATIQRHDCDISVSSQNITAERLGHVAFVAYSESLQPVLVATGNPEDIEQLIDLCGRAVSATTGTTHVDLVHGTGEYVGRGLNAACAAADGGPIDLQTFSSEQHAVTALLSGDVVAYLGNPNFAAAFPTQIEYSRATLPPARQGITTARDRPALYAAVAATLAEMMADGTYREILVDHLPSDESVRVVSILE